ncbi:MAG: glycogen synthase [Christensenellaceae bacterium]|jgi:starch synthase
MKPKVLMVGAECAPFAKAGGLADVMGALPKALQQNGIEVRVLMPMHQMMKKKYSDKAEILLTMCVNLGGNNQCLRLKKMVIDDIVYYLVDNKFHYGYAIYKGGEMEMEQYAYLCRALLEVLPYLDYQPNILHLNDWHTSLVPVLLKTQYPQYDLKTMLTIHNLQYQGECTCEFIKDALHVGDAYCTDEYLGSGGDVNMLKGGINFADVITTVSPTYAKEILSKEFGYGLESALAKRKTDLIGILNGINTDEFDPSADEAIKQTYTLESIGKKRENKKALLDETSLEVGIETPIIGMVTRMVEQKGLDILEKAMDELLTLDVGFVMLGNGDPSFEKYFDLVGKWSRGKAHVHIGYANEFAHQIYAGCDFFLMPSMFEPCGLAQMIAQCYGTLPIVHSTGGLKDTVIPHDKEGGNGFCFAEYTSEAMMDSIQAALEVYKDKSAMDQLIKNAMSEDNSFSKSAQKYIEVYEKLLT